MGWDYYVYASQPLFFLDAVKQFLKEEQQAKMKAYKESEMKMKMSRRR